MTSAATASGFPAFTPHPLLRGPHAQTLGSMWHRDKKYPYVAERHRLRLEDGDRIVLHDDCPARWRISDPVALMLPGLTGCYLSKYQVRIAAKLNQRGVRTFRVDHRGWGAGVGLAKQFCHAGRSADLFEAAMYVTDLCPDSSVSIAGFSMGGNIALKMLGEFANDLPVTVSRAAIIGPPLDLAACSDSMESDFARRAYNRHFTKTLRRHLRRHRLWPAEGMTPIPRTLRKFDAAFTAPRAGFISVDDYYKYSSANRVTSEIAIPTLILGSEDDPIVPAACLREASYSDQVTVHLTKRGGHLGFLGAASKRDPDRRWMDWRVVEWFCC